MLQTTSSFAGVAAIALVLSTVINYADIVSGIYSLFRKAFDFRNAIEKIYYKGKRDKYYKSLCDKDLIAWQLNVLETIYKPIIDKDNRVDFTELVIGKTKKRYESVTFKLNSVNYPFDNVCPKNDLKVNNDTNDTNNAESLEDFYKKFSRICNRYYSLIRGTIRYPKRIGYMLDELIIRENGWQLKSHVGNYEGNIKTSHILEYELYNLYKRHKYNTIYDRDWLLNHLPIRNYIHKKNNETEFFLRSGSGRESLLSVQMFVMVKNHSNSYDALRIRRSSDVTAKAGYLQFVPSGGFKSINDCTDFDSQWSNYFISKVIFRELLEGCFGINEDDERISGNNVTTDKIYHNRHIKNLIDMIVNKNRDKLELVGIVESLGSLG